MRQLTHEAEDVAPSSGLLVPASHSKQASSEVADVASARYLPERQEAQDAAPGGEKVPVPQSEHVVAPVEDENLPASQEEQAEDSTPVAESVRYFPAAHLVQEADAVEE